MKQAIWNDTILASSDDTVVVENNHYFPPASLAHEHFRESSHTTVCPWKGTAHYYDVLVGDAVNANAAWLSLRSFSYTSRRAIWNLIQAR